MLNKKLFFRLRRIAYLTVCILLGVHSNSFAQTEWTKYAGNPVLRKGTYPEWDYIGLSDPDVIKDDDTLKMWYTGVGIVFSDSNAKPRIGYAYSFNGINWTEYPGNPVLIPSPGEWDSLGTETVTIIKDTTTPSNERYRMWYAGVDDDIHYDIGYAYSPDGINWIKYPNNPVLSVGPDSSWENAFLEGPTVIKDGDTLKMWYAGVDTIPNNQPTDYHVNIGYAWSLDGVNWAKYPGNPVFTVGDSVSWDFGSVADPCVKKIGDTYFMWYAGRVWANKIHQVGYAFSSDGINWVKSDSNPVLKRGEPSSWDRTTSSFPSVICDGSFFHMWYTGIDTFPLPPWPEPYHWDIGYATALIGIEENTRAKVRNVKLEAYLNPFTQKTVIYYHLPGTEKQWVKLQIFDLAGRRIKILVDEKQASGRHSISWDGRNEAGRKIASGVYFYKLKNSNKFSQTKKLLLLR